MDSVNDILFDSLREFIHRLVNFIPNVLMMFLIVLIGVVLSAIVRFVLLWFLRLFKFDPLTEKWGVPQALAKGGIKVAPSRIVANVSYWGLLLIFFMMGFVALDIVPVNNLVSEFFTYLPSIIASVLIIVIGFIFGNFVERAVSVAASNAEIERPDLVAKGVKLFIVVMAASMALDQLGIARGIIIAAFSISFGGIVLAVSLAFGLGAKEMAREFLEKKIKKERKEPAIGNIE